MAEPTERIAILLELQQQEFEKRAKSAGNAIDRLERKFNPLAAAEAKLTKQQDRFNAALEAGTIDAKQHAKGLDLLQREYDQTADKLSRAKNNVVAMNSASAAQAGFMTRNRFAFQQAGYQVGDFAVQVQGGTSAVTAFTQQGSQMLGVFGAWGAVMGAVLAIAAPLGAALWNSGASAEAYDESLKGLNKALDAYQTAAREARLTSQELRTEFGSQAEGIREQLQLLEQLNLVKALDSLKESVAQIDISRLRDLVGILSQGKGEISAFDDNYNRALKEVQDQFKLSAEQAGAFLQSLNALRSADGPEATIAAARELNGFLLDVFGTAENIPPVLADMARNLVEADKAASRIVATTEDAETAFGNATQKATELSELDLVSNIMKGAAAAWNMAAAFTQSVADARKLAQINSDNQQAAMTGGGRGDGMAELRRRNGGGNPNADKFVYNGPRLDQFNNVVPSKSGGGSSRGGGSGGGGSSYDLFAQADQQIAKLEQQIEMLGKTDAEVASLTLKYKMLAEAKKRGIPITDELTAKIEAEAAKVGVLSEQYANAKDKTEALQQIQEDWEGSVVDATMGGVDAMDQFIDSIKRAALEYALFGKGSFASEGSSFKGLLGGIAGSIFGARANGGPVSGGKPYLVNENTPNSEIFVPSKGGGILNVPQAKEALRRSAAMPVAPAPPQRALPPQVIRVEGGNLTMSDDGKIFTQMRVVAGQAGSQAVESVKGNLSGWNTQLQTDGALS